jgi:hypothetical protein
MRVSACVSKFSFQHKYIKNTLFAIFVTLIDLHVNALQT